MTRPQKFRAIAEEIASLYEKKDKAYGNSFGSTYEKLGIISAVTRISDKYNRLCNLATNADVDNLGESIEDTLKDMVAYGIMTLMEIKKAKPLVIEPKNVDSIAGFKVGDEVQEVLSDLIRRDRKIKEIILHGSKIVFLFEDGGFASSYNEEDLKTKFILIKKHKYEKKI